MPVSAEQSQKTYSSTSGQALLLVLLAMAVVLTLVLSGLSRSVTDVQVTATREDSQRAYTAAESGVEQALLAAGNISLNLGNGSSFDAQISGVGEGKQQYVYPSKLSSGESGTFWFVSHKPDNTLACTGNTYPCFTGSSLSNICWGDDPTIDSETPALELTVYYDPAPGQPGIAAQDFSTVKVVQGVYDANLTRVASNKFAQATTDCTVDGQHFAFKTGTVNLNTLGVPPACNGIPGCLIMARARLIYNDDKHSIGIKTPLSQVLPSQGRQIVSTGNSGVSTRKIEVFETFPELPLAFDTAVFSPFGLAHQ